MGGGAQVGQVAIGAISEADRHNIRGEKISVDTIPLVGEQPLAEAVRAVPRLPRARVLVLAGSLMGGEIEKAVREVRAAGADRDQPQHGGQRAGGERPGRHRSRAGRRDGRDGDRGHGAVLDRPADQAGVLKAADDVAAGLCPAVCVATPRGRGGGPDKVRPLHLEGAVDRESTRVAAKNWRGGGRRGGNDGRGRAGRRPGRSGRRSGCRAGEAGRVAEAGGLPAQEHAARAGHACREGRVPGDRHAHAPRRAQSGAAGRAAVAARRADGRSAEGDGRAQHPHDDQPHRRPGRAAGERGGGPRSRAHGAVPDVHRAVVDRGPAARLTRSGRPTSSRRRRRLARWA